jgi:hypothetical protein
MMTLFREVDSGENANEEEDWIMEDGMYDNDDV